MNTLVRTGSSFKETGRSMQNI